MAVCTIDNMTAADIDQIVSIEKTSFKRPWSSNSYQSEIDCKTSTCLIVRYQDDNGTICIAAYICFRLFADEMHILKIAVAPEWQGLGLATQLIKKSFETAREKGTGSAFLEVRPSNRKAISLYGKIGFKVIGKRPFYYIEDREDALVMRYKFEGGKK